MRRSSRLLITLLATVLIVGVAQAHVSIWPREVPAKSFQAFTVRVPTEKDVPTLQIRLTFPPEVEVLRFKPKEGWRYEIERDAAGRIAGVTWSGGRIGRDEYDEFAFVGRVGDQTGRLMFKAYQTYQGGEVVEWVNAAEPHPAPMVEVTPALPAVSSAPTDPFAAPADPGVTPTAAPRSTARTTFVSHALSGLALAVAIVALARSRKSS